MAVEPGEPEPAEWANVMPLAARTATTTTAADTSTSADRPVTPLPPDRQPDRDGTGRLVEDHYDLEAPADGGDTEPAATAASQSAELAPDTTETASAGGGGGPDGAAETTFTARINGLRSAQGLAALAPDGALAGSARAWAERMASRGSLGHSNLGRFLPPWSSVAENVAVGNSVEGIFSSLDGSGSHRANMLDEFTHLGVGVWVDGDGTMWTVHLFAR